jgi:UDP-GlcNAc:undecaprenyl-phosphate/decaprenyl-phosphate GlcNAc-1-phosphate transferase
MYLSYPIFITLSFVVSLLTTPLVIAYFKHQHWIENPQEKQKKSHNATALRTVPRGGGIPVFLGIFLVSLSFLPFDKHLRGIFFASLLTLIVGVWDDIKDVSPKIRLLTNLITALIIVASGIGIAYISNPFGSTIDLSFLSISFQFFGNHSIWIISDLLAIVWIVWCMNIVGWSAGVDGQLPGFVSISALFIGLLGLKHSTDITQWPVIILAGAICGSYLGFLLFNFYPQKIMPGYSGKSLAGLLLAVLGILAGAKLATLILLLGIPMIDAVYVLTRRITSRRSPLTGGPDHLHHRLLQLRWSRPQISFFYFFCSLVFGIISLFLNSQQKFYAFISIILLFFSFILVVSRRT